jgi:hypothetical protein
MVPALLRVPEFRMRALHRATVACVALVPAAVLLDAWRSPPAAGGLMWLDLAALACLGWAVAQPGALRDAEAWTTPLNGLVIALLAIVTVAAIPGGGTGEAASRLGQVLACSGIYLGLASVMRRDARAVESVWRALGVVAVVLGLHALWAATSGFPQLAVQAGAVDARWCGRQTLARALLFLTLATAGRAAERGASPGWRLAWLVGAAGVGIHAAGGGFVFESRALARLDEPLYFSTASVTFMVAVVLAHEAWRLARSHPAEVMRWRCMAAAMAVLGVSGVLGGSSGGEGVRSLVAIAGAAVVATRKAARALPVPVMPAAERSAVLSRAA